MVYELGSFIASDNRPYATVVQESSKSHQLAVLDQPLYVNIGSPENINLDPARYMHTIHLNPNKLLLYFRAVQNGQITFNDKYIRQIFELTSGILFNEASLHDVVNYSASKRPEQKFIWGSPQEAYHLVGQEFFSYLSKDTFPTLEIHDAIIHPTQFRVWPDFYYPLAGLLAFSLNNLDPGHRFTRFLDFSYFATAEYGLAGFPIEKAAPLGCLLYTYPRKNPMRWANISSIDAPDRLLTKWESLRASSSLSRRFQVHQRDIVTQIDWYNFLGYSLPDTLIPEYDSNAKRFVEPITKIEDPNESVRMSEVCYPSTIEDLMELVLKKIEEEFLLLSDVSSMQKKKIDDIISKIKIT